MLCAQPAAHAEDLQDAHALYRHGQYSQAMEKIGNILAGNPGDAKARFLKGLIYAEQGNVPEAARIFQALTADHPELPEPHNNLAAIYASQGQYDKAKLSLEAAIRTHPSYATAHENLGDIYAKLASQAYDRALHPDRNNTPTQTKLALIQELYENSSSSKSPPVQDNVAPIQACLDPCSKPEKQEVQVAAVAPPEPPPAAIIKTAQPEENTREVLDTVTAWADAWSAQNVEKYLSFYADDFKTPHGESRAEWAATRKQRVSTPKSIKVIISRASVKFSDKSHATVKFRQHYRASHLKVAGSKTLLMVKSGNKWLIQEERSR